jgi:hypothetical protein
MMPLSPLDNSISDQTVMMKMSDTSFFSQMQRLDESEERNNRELKIIVSDSPYSASEIDKPNPDLRSFSNSPRSLGEETIFNGSLEGCVLDIGFILSNLDKLAYLRNQIRVRRQNSAQTKGIISRLMNQSEEVKQVIIRNNVDVSDVEIHRLNDEP